MLGNGNLLPAVWATVVPVDAEQVQPVGGAGVDGSEGGADPLGDLAGIGQLGEGGEEDPRGPEPLGGSLQDRGVGELTLNLRSSTSVSSRMIALGSEGRPLALCHRQSALDGR